MSMLKIKIFLAVFCGSLQVVFGQPNASNDRSKALKNYEQKSVHEKIFVHTDKDFYLAGEIIWFKLYYVEATSHVPLDLSKLAYVEIVDKDLKPVLQGKVGLNEGSGNGSFYLPASIGSGMYRLRAYTQWMKNFKTEYFFEKSLTVVNSFKSLEKQPAQSPGYEIGFFPEGGQLVDNIQSKLAFKITDRFGKGMSYHGIIVNQDNDTVTNFQPFKFGIGNCVFTPKPGDVYKALIRMNDTLLTSELPKAREQGYVMAIKNDDQSKVRISVATNLPEVNSVYLVIHARQTIRLSEQLSMSNGAAEFLVDKHKFGEGVSHITVLNNLKQPVCERLYFVRPASRLMLDASANNQQFSSRSKVGIQVLAKDETGKPVPAALSASVFKLDTDIASNAGSITSYLWLTSELNGAVESPGYYLQQNDPGVEEAVDNLMLTHGWRRFTWEELSSTQKTRPEFLPELTSHIIHAKITNPRTGLPANDVLTYLSVPGRRVQLYSSKSDASGRLKFYTNDFYGPNEILLQTESHWDTSYRIEIVSPFSEKASQTPLPAFDLPGTLQNPLIDYNVGVQVQNIFAGDKLNQLYGPVIDSNAFYGPPDNSYLLDNYIRFSTMEEVLREYVMEVLVRRQKETFRLIMSGGLENRVFLDDPLTLFNGVPVFDPNKIMQYDPLKVQKIEVVKRRYFYGSSIMNGIVNFITYQPDPVMLSGLNAVVFDYEGLLFEREFYSPMYETREQLTSRSPDFRNVLFWSPAIKTGSDGKTEFSFYTSDQKGQYAAVLQGLSGNGRAGEQIVTFTVK